MEEPESGDVPAEATPLGSGPGPGQTPTTAGPAF